MTPDFQARLIVDEHYSRIDQYADPDTQAMDAACLKAAIEGAIRAERRIANELREEVARLKRAIQSIPYDQRPTDPHHGGKLHFPEFSDVNR